MKVQRYDLVWHPFFYNVATFQSSWKWFIYTRAQNVNRTPNDDDAGPSKKKSKLDSLQKHDYPPIPPSAKGEISNERNMHLLKEEWGRAKQVTESIKELFIHTHAVRRSLILSAEYTSTCSVLQVLEFLILKRCMYVSSRSSVSTLIYCTRFRQR